MGAPFTEVLRLAYDPRGVTSGLSQSRSAMQQSRAAADAMRQALGAAVTVVAGSLTKIAADHDAARKSIAGSTGATGQDLKRLQGIYLSTLGQVRSSSAETAAAVAALSKLQGGQGPILAAAAVAAEKAAAAYGRFDLSALQGGMSAFNLEAGDAPRILDAMGGASARLGVPLAKLVLATQTYGPGTQKCEFLDGPVGGVVWPIGGGGGSGVSCHARD